MWLFLGLGFAAAAVADFPSTCFRPTSATTYAPGAVFDVLLAGLDAPDRVGGLETGHGPPARADTETQPSASWSIPALAGLTAIVVLVYDHATASTRLRSCSRWSRFIVIRVARMTFRENGRMLERIHRQAITDSLTRLGNRRSLITDLDRALEATEDGAERILIILDLNGFKRYNDTFGHPSGDQLLRRLSDQLREAGSATRRRVSARRGRVLRAYVVPEGVTERCSTRRPKRCRRRARASA